MFTAYAQGQQPRTFDDENAAVSWAQGYESGEVIDNETDRQVWQHWPEPEWV